MKQKDVIFAVLAVVILLVAGYIAYTQIMPQKKESKTVEVEKVDPIPNQLDAGGMVWLNDPVRVVDYNSKPDYTGLGNKAPFGP